MFALPQVWGGGVAMTRSQPNNMIKIHGTTAVPDVLIREMLVIPGKGT